MIGSELWDLRDLLSIYGNFKEIQRVQPDKPQEEIAQVVEGGGTPVIIEGYHGYDAWQKDILSIGWVEETLGCSRLDVRNVDSFTDKQLSIKEYLEHCRNWKGRWSSEAQERIYAKDMKCPEEWIEWLKSGQLIPKELVFFDKSDVFRYLPESFRPETLMCYLGTHDTYTPAHKDLCGSVGHNLMVDTESQGSAFWFMTKTSDADAAAQYLQSLGYELDHENHALTLEQLSRAPFEIYVGEQRKGDMILVPPSSMHQVVNQGGVSLKVSWSRMTPRSLQIAIQHELHIYRRVCRKEVYRCKMTTYAAVQHLANVLGNESAASLSSSGLSVVERQKAIQDLEACLTIYEDILMMEWSSTNYPRPPDIDPTLANVDVNDLLFDEPNLRTCDFCEGDIFNGLFVCSNPECSSVQFYKRNVDLCAGCYTEGRSCDCGKMEIHQLRDFKELEQLHQYATEVLGRVGGKTRESEKKDASDQRTGEFMKIFEAACILHEMHTSKRYLTGKPTLACRVSGNSHELRRYMVIACKPCHCGFCYPHLLEWGLHSTEVLLNLDAVHELHVKGKLDARSGGLGIDPVGTKTLSRITQRYKNSMRNVDLSLKHLRLGFYDDSKLHDYIVHSFIVTDRRASIAPPHDDDSKPTPSGSESDSDPSFSVPGMHIKRSELESVYRTRLPRKASLKVKSLVLQAITESDGFDSSKAEERSNRRRTIANIYIPNRPPRDERSSPNPPAKPTNEKESPGWKIDRNNISRKKRRMSTGPSKLDSKEQANALANTTDVNGIEYSKKRRRTSLGPVAKKFGKRLEVDVTPVESAPDHLTPTDLDFPELCSHRATSPDTSSGRTRTNSPRPVDLESGFDVARTSKALGLDTIPATLSISSHPLPLIKQKWPEHRLAEQAEEIRKLSERVSKLELENASKDEEIDRLKNSSGSLNEALLELVKKTEEQKERQVTEMSVLREEMRGLRETLNSSSSRPPQYPRRSKVHFNPGRGSGSALNRVGYSQGGQFRSGSPHYHRAQTSIPVSPVQNHHLQSEFHFNPEPEYRNNDLHWYGQFNGHPASYR